MIEFIHVTSARDDRYDLIRHAYDRLIVPAFPNPDERDPYEKFINGADDALGNLKLITIIAAENAHDPARRVIHGISVGYYYEKENVGALMFNAIHPESRGLGLGRKMVDARIDVMKEMAAARGKTLTGVVLDVHSLDKVPPAEDSIDPAKRQAIYRGWGARKIPIDYVQPPVHEDADYCDLFDLLAFPVDGKYATPRDVEGFLRAIYSEWTDKPEQDPHYVASLRQLKKWKGFDSAPAAKEARPAGRRNDDVRQAISPIFSEEASAKNGNALTLSRIEDAPAAGNDPFYARAAFAEAPFRKSVLSANMIALYASSSHYKP